MTQQKIRELLLAEDGAIQGERIIVGTIRLNQYVIYQGRCIQDLHNYTPAQKDGLMLATAKQILFQLISGRCLDAKPASDYGL